MTVRTGMVAVGPSATMPTPKAWWRADDLALSDGDPVGTWTDRTGNGYDMTQSGSARPAFKTNILNSTMPVVRFDGSDDTMNSSLLSSATTGWTMVLAAKNLNTSDFARVVFHNGDSTSNGYGVSLLTSNRRVGALYPGVAWIEGDASHTSDTSLHIVILFRHYDTGASTWVLDMVDGGTGYFLSNTASSPSTPTTRASFGGPEGTRYWNGDIAEAMFYDSVLDFTDMNLIGQYLAARWGGSWSNLTANP